VTLDWTGIASCKELRKLYKTMSIEELADYLGVGYETCRKRLHKCRIKRRKQGGTRYEFPRETLPDNAADMSTAQLMKLTGFTAGHARKIRRELRRQRDEKNNRNRNKNDGKGGAEGT